METEKVLGLISEEIKALEAKKRKIKNAAKASERYLFIEEENRIKKISAQQMIIRKVARKIQKLTQPKL